MKKVMFTAFAVGLCLSANVMAQVPSYVPTNGLVGWWPFNGNANDESGNGNNGTVNGATLSTDRIGYNNSAYSFDGVNDFILVSNSSSLQSPSVSLTISAWFKIDAWDNNFPPFGYASLISKSDANSCQYRLAVSTVDISLIFNGVNLIRSYSQNSIQLDTWNNLVVTIDQNGNSFYLNGSLYGVSNNQNNENFGVSQNLEFGRDQIGGSDYINGKLDDIGIWNRALTDQEISALYNNCSGNEITTQPANSVNTIGSNAQLSVNAAVGSTYQWQSNPLNTGWLNLTNNSTYSGATSNTLNVSNTTVSNHNQPFRAIVNTGGCIDTSNVAQIIIGDTCLTTVTDTLIINTTLGLPAPNNENTILIYPNPASDHITIDNGNFAAMAGYSIKIENNAGQQVFQSLINQAQFYVDLSTWSGNGLYFVHLIDPQNNTVTVRKIVLQ